MEGDNSTCGVCFSSRELLLLNVIHPGFALLSFAFCLVAIAAVFHLKLQQHFNYRLVVYWLFSNALFSFVLVIYLPIGWYDPNNTAFVGYCKFLSVILLYSVWTVLLMTVVVVMEIFSLVVHSSQFSKLEIPCILLAFLLPLLFCWIPFTTDSYGFNGPGCGFIVEDENGSIILAGAVELFVLLVLPGGVLFLLCILAVLAVIVAFVLRTCVTGRSKRSTGASNLQALQEQEDELTNKYRKALKETLPLLVYPIAYGGLSLFVVLGLVVQIVVDSSQFQISLANALALSIIGFCAALASIIHLLIIARKTKKRIKSPALAQSNQLQQQIVNPDLLSPLRSDTVTHPTQYDIMYESDTDNPIV